MKTMMAVTFLLFAGLALAVSAEEGLVARWDFDAGTGSVLEDLVGDAHGTIHGGRWVRVGDGYALELNGKGDYVDFGNPASLSPDDAITVSAWVYPTRVPSAGEAGVIGKAYHNWVITYYQDGKCWWYTGQSGTNTKATVSPGAWHHVVGTYDGSMLALYVDGRLADRRPANTGRIPSGVNCYMGKSDGDVQWTKNAHFAGMLDDVSIYNRALTEAEIVEQYRTTHITNTPDVQAFVYYANREIVVQAGLRGFASLPQDARAVAEAYRAGQTGAVATGFTAPLAGSEDVTISLQSEQFAPGDYRIRVWVADADGARIGSAARSEAKWPEVPSWGVDDPRIRVLNSMVSELRIVTGIADARTVIDFTNPRDGWVFFSATSTTEPAGRVTITLPEVEYADRQLVQDGQSPRTVEAMRRLPAGRGEITVECTGGARVENLVIRAIPEIGYCRVDSGPQIKPYGACDWEFLREHVLPHINLAVGHASFDEQALREEWKRQGKRWITETPLPGLGNPEGITADMVEKAWIERGHLDNPLVDGIIVDEFAAGDDPIWAEWHEALKRIRDNPRYAGKVYYPYCGPLHGAQASRAFAQTVIDAGWAVALERYLHEEATEADARHAINTLVVDTVKAWEEAQPGVVRNMLMVWGFFISAPPESTNIYPNVDLKAFTDMQMNVLANDPTFFGLYGITSYLSGYSDEETIRWYGKLCRHYCIEGKTERLTDYYELDHIDNPDFEQGLTGWTVKPAEQGSITAGVADGLSWLQGRYPTTTVGNTHMLMRRSAVAPNSVTQTIRGLKPGRLYSVKMFSGDKQEYDAGKSVKGPHAVQLAVEGAEIVEGSSFQFPFGSCYSHHFGDFNRDNPYFMNFYGTIFRARSETARLTITDWASPTEPGGPIGQELMINFLEVQPYYAE